MQKYCVMNLLACAHEGQHFLISTFKFKVCIEIDMKSISCHAPELKTDQWISKSVEVHVNAITSKYDWRQQFGNFPKFVFMWNVPEDTVSFL